MKTLHARQRQRGVAAIELAIVLGVLITAAFGISELGRAMYHYDTLTKSARDAARYLSLHAPGSATHIANARNLAVCGAVDCSGLQTLAPGLTTAMVGICDRTSCPGTHNNQSTTRGVVNVVTVTIGGGATPYTFTPVVTWTMRNAISFGPISASMTQLVL